MRLWKKVLSAVTAGALCVGGVGLPGVQNVLESVGTVLSASAGVPRSYDGTYGDLYYVDYGDSVSIVGCNEDATSVEIPKEIDGKSLLSDEHEYVFLCKGKDDCYGEIELTKENRNIILNCPCFKISWKKASRIKT